MARRKRSLKLEISLFAFQDIIISVTGVLILIILLLVLEITIHSDTDGLQQAFAASAAELREELQVVKDEIDQTATELEDSRHMVKQATLNPESLINNKLAQENDAIDDLNKKVSHLDSIANEIEQKKQKHAQVVKKNRKQEQESIKQAQEELATLEKKKRLLEEKMTEMGKEDQTHYLAPRGIQPKRAWMCDVSSRGLELVLIDGTGRKVTLRASNLESESPRLFNNLNRWLRKQKPTPEYILFVIRPSGADFSDILGLKGDQLIAEIGVEFVTEDHIIKNRKNED